MNITIDFDELSRMNRIREAHLRNIIENSEKHLNNVERSLDVLMNDLKIFLDSYRNLDDLGKEALPEDLRELYRNLNGSQLISIWHQISHYKDQEGKSK